MINFDLILFGFCCGIDACEHIFRYLIVRNTGCPWFIWREKVIWSSFFRLVSIEYELLEYPMKRILGLSGVSCSLTRAKRMANRAIVPFELHISWSTSLPQMPRKRLKKRRWRDFSWKNTSQTNLSVYIIVRNKWQAMNLICVIHSSKTSYEIR